MIHYEIKLRVITEEGHYQPWEETQATPVTVKDMAQLRDYAEKISATTGREVRANAAGSLQGHYFGRTVRPELQQPTTEPQQAPVKPQPTITAAMKAINAKWASKCAETGARIAKGAEMVYDYAFKKCYSATSATYKAFKDHMECNREAFSIAAYIQAQEDAMYGR